MNSFYDTRHSTSSSMAGIFVYTGNIMKKMKQIIGAIWRPIINLFRGIFGFLRHFKIRVYALILLAMAVGIGFFVYHSEISRSRQFQLGLDLSGGARLTYRADVSNISIGEIPDSLASLRDVLERRVNMFGVSEPIVNSETAMTGSGREHRVSIELPGVTDVNRAITMIGQTPVLEFRTENPAFNQNTDSNEPITITSDMVKNGQIDMTQVLALREPFSRTELTGRFLSRASLQFDSQTRKPIVAIQFNEEGSKLFEKMTTDNIGKRIAIYLDGSAISIPRVNQAIVGGQATITGDFTPEEAKQLVGRLNSGALPVPIELVATDTVGPTLGIDAVRAGVFAGIVSLIMIAVLLLFWYRLPGIIAIVSLSIYSVVMLALFKLIPVTLTSAGIAGFIISLGMAVDANILIFERMKEELVSGKSIRDALHTGFDRAWTSIRDGNISSIISACVLFFAGTTLMQGFALTFGIGVLVSMLTAITCSRVFLRALGDNSHSRVMKFLYKSGITR